MMSFYRCHFTHVTVVLRISKTLCSSSAKLWFQSLNRRAESRNLGHTFWPTLYCQLTNERRRGATFSLLHQWCHHANSSAQNMLSLAFDFTSRIMSSYRVVQLDFTPEIEVFCMLFDTSLSIFTMTSVRQ